MKRMKDVFQFLKTEIFPLGGQDLLVSLGFFSGVTVVSFFFNRTASDPTLNIAMLYTLGVYLVSRYTNGYLYGLLFSLAGVLSVNFFFTFPYQDFNFTLEGYQVTFIGMLVISIITSITGTRMKKQQEILLKQEKELMEAEKEKMRANLLRAISHDLRTPLTGIIGNSESFLETGENMEEEEKTDLIRNIHDDANWLLNMVENLLSVTRIDSETSEASITKSIEAVDEVVSSSMAKFRKRFPETPVQVKLSEEVLMAEMDSVLIEQVILNILQNAAIHAESREPILFFVDSDDGNIIFHIRDFGRGIEEGRLRTIFDGGGYRSGQEKSDSYKGMGLGLSLCKTIIRAHRGTIHAINHVRGVEFVFSLPRFMEEYEYVSESFDLDH